MMLQNRDSGQVATKILTREEIFQALGRIGIDIAAFRSSTTNQLADMLHELRIAIESYTPGKIIGRPQTDKGPMPSLSLVDKKIMKSLIASSGDVSSLELARSLEIPLSTVQRRRKRLEATFLDTSYSLKVEKLGWRIATLFISTHSGMTASIGRELLSWESIISVCRTMGENTIDLKVEIVFKQNAELVNIIERMKSINGVKNVFWTESIEVLGRNNDRFALIIDNI